MQQEVVEASGHLIDSHVMEQIFDKVVEGVRFRLSLVRFERFAEAAGARRSTATKTAI